MLLFVESGSLFVVVVVCCRCCVFLFAAIFVWGSLSCVGCLSRVVCSWLFVSCCLKLGARRICLLAAVGCALFAVRCALCAAVCC